MHTLRFSIARVHFIHFSFFYIVLHVPSHVNKLNISLHTICSLGQIWNFFVFKSTAWENAAIKGELLPSELSHGPQMQILLLRTDTLIDA